MLTFVKCYHRMAFFLYEKVRCYMKLMNLFSVDYGLITILSIKTNVTLFGTGYIFVPGFRVIIVVYLCRTC